ETDFRGRKTENIKRIRAVWQDDDEGYRGKYPIKPSMEVQTSQGKFQRYWLVNEYWTRSNDPNWHYFKQVMRRLVETYGNDKNAIDPPRVLRLPGFYHLKAEPYQVQLKRSDGRGYTKEEIIEAFPPISHQDNL
ncbi:MAG: DNA-primase RepB domain-containing protein, partial [Methyloligellaceae bacterium]